MLEIVLNNYEKQLHIAMQVLIAGVFGGMVGLEREYADKPAGLRTHAFVACTAALLVGMADILIAHFAVETAPQTLRTDPIRIVEAIVTGVAFLGAGTIFRHQHEDAVEGLTTAASLLLVAGIGIAVALSQWILALVITVLTLLLLRVARLLKPNS